MDPRVPAPSPREAQSARALPVPCIPRARILTPPCCLSQPVQPGGAAQGKGPQRPARMLTGASLLACRPVSGDWAEWEALWVAQPEAEVKEGPQGWEKRLELQGLLPGAGSGWWPRPRPPPGWLGPWLASTEGLQGAGLSVPDWGSLWAVGPQAGAASH